MGLSLTPDDERDLDARYVGFDGFDRWVGIGVDEARWRGLVGFISPMRAAAEGAAWRQRIETLIRASELNPSLLPEGDSPLAAVLTATQPSLVQAAITAGRAGVLALYEAEARLRTLVWDIADSGSSPEEPIIRRLHEEACCSQPGYVVMDNDGRTDFAPLPWGEYKSERNFGVGAGGELWPFAPVEMTQAEIIRLLAELRTSTFHAAHPVIQAAYSLYGILAIHPFPDGNGRVARAAASVYLCRAIGLPLILALERRPQYLRCLLQARSGQTQPLVDLVLQLCEDAVTKFWP